LSIAQFSVRGNLAGLLLVAGLGCGRSSTIPRAGDGAVDATSSNLGGSGDTGAVDASVDQAEVPFGSVATSSIATTATGSIVLAGLLQGSVDLGNGLLSSAGGRDLLLANFDPSGSPVWSRRFGDATDQGSAYIATGGTGDIVVATGFRGVLDLGTGPLVSAGDADVAVAKFSAKGDLIWSVRLGDADLQVPSAVAIDSTGAIVVVVRFGSGLPNEGSDLVKLSPSGEVVWSRSWLGAELSGIGIGPSDSVYATGWFWNSVDFGGGPSVSPSGVPAIFLFALTPSGDWAWNKRFGSGYANALAVDGSGNSVVVGDFNGTVDFGTGAPLVSVRDPGRFGPSDDLFIAKLGPSGEGIWSRQFGDTVTDETATSVAVDALGAIVVLGNGGSSLDFGFGPFLGGSGSGFVVRFDSAGQALWNRANAGTVAATLPSLTVLVGGGFPVGTAFSGATRTFVGGTSVFLVEYAP